MGPLERKLKVQTAVLRWETLNNLEQEIEEAKTALLKAVGGLDEQGFQEYASKTQGIEDANN